MVSILYGEQEYCKGEHGNFITDEYTHTLRLESELLDLRVGYANQYPKHKCFECVRCEYGTKIKT